MNILGIETSCDETAAAVVEDGSRILSNVVANQFDLHRPFGGVVPEVAARAHTERITAVIDEAMTIASCTPAQLDGIAVVNGPGLVGALLVGISAAKSLAIAWDKPLVGINHILGHVYAAILAGFNRFPHVSLIVSGGHTCLYRVNNLTDIVVLGQTTDDAAGEAFDKVAKMLNLGFPGGPALSKLADQARPDQRKFFLNINKKLDDTSKEGALSLNFSFSGLKTAVYYNLRGTTYGRGPLRVLTEDERAEVAASFQEVACEMMVSRALAACARENIRALTIGGGVACNRRLREMLKERAAGTEVFFPPPELCSDNAAMSAGLAFHRLRKNEHDTLDLDADPTPSRA
ncbi:MAG: tRNA (adenosine(37)-N6)-threonylcarbamoyltransferase complex transferase subunit TsaD [Planctomycetota bacterium]